MNHDEPWYVPDPSKETDLVIDGFLRALEEIVPPGALVDAAAIVRRAGDLGTEHAARARDVPSTHNLRYACVVLAGYEALAPQISDDQAVASLRAAFARSGTFVREKTRAALDESRDPFRDLVNVSKEREASQFGPSFELRRVQDDDRAYLLEVRRCFWHDFFVAVGRPALTTVLCEFDANWIEAIDPPRHGFVFERPTTLGYGGTHCPFHFRRLTRRERG